MDLLSDKNTEIRKMSSVALDIVMEYDKEWVTQNHPKFSPKTGQTNSREKIPSTQQPMGRNRRRRRQGNNLPTLFSLF
jgi:hypothetical protein